MINKEDIQNIFKLRYKSEEVENIFKNIEATPEILSDMLDEKEWDNIEIGKKLPYEKANELWFDISHKIKNVTSKSFYITRIVIAASIIFVIGMGGAFLLYRQKSIIKSTISSNAIVEKNNLVRSNTTSSIISFKLSDGSTINLMPGSTISFPKEFDKTKREVRLFGEADFIVSKIASQLFLVITEKIITKVLGTEFRVKSNEKDPEITVELFKGKVAIIPNDSLKLFTFPDVILRPGEKIVLNKKSGLMAIINTLEKPTVVKKRIENPVEYKLNTISIPANVWYMFGNQSLDQVFEQLQEIYGVNIKFKYNDVMNIRYIGRIDSSDNLEQILNTIALLNGLQVTKSAKGFYIHTK